MENGININARIEGETADVLVRLIKNIYKAGNKYNVASDVQVASLEMVGKVLKSKPISLSYCSAVDNSQKPVSDYAMPDLSFDGGGECDD